MIVINFIFVKCCSFFIRNDVVKRVDILFVGVLLKLCGIEKLEVMVDLDINFL